MPTVDEWQEALCRQYQVTIDSSAELCEEVYQAQLQKNRERRRKGLRPLRTKPIIPFPAGSPGQRVSRLVKPIDVLHAIGLVTTPTISELVDLSSTWAEVRYLWAFRPVFGAPGRPRVLRMNDIVKDLDFHQKTLLSDELGVGFGAYFMLEEVKATDPVDAYVAMKNGQYGLRGTRRRSIPDYIFRSANGSDYYVLECKGTQSGKSTAINQLRRGTEQVQAVTIVPPAQVIRVVVAASLKDVVTVYVIDPPGDSREHDPDAIPIEPLVRWSPPELASFAAAKRLTYIGDHLGADAVLGDAIERRLPTTKAARPLERHETDMGVFMGTSDGRRTPDGRTLTIFRGLVEEQHTRDVSRPSIALPAALSGLAAPNRVFKTSARHIGNAASVRSFSPEGTLLEIRIE